MHCGNSRLTPTEKCVVEGEEQRSAAERVCHCTAARCLALPDCACASANSFSCLTRVLVLLRTPLLEHAACIAHHTFLFTDD